MANENGNGNGSGEGLSREAGDVSALAPAFQRMAAQAKALQERAESPAVAWWAKGQQDAYELCAERIREVIKPTVRVGPVHQTNAMLDAFKACLAMLEGLGGGADMVEEVEDGSGCEAE